MLKHSPLLSVSKEFCIQRVKVSVEIEHCLDEHSFLTNSYLLFSQTVRVYYAKQTEIDTSGAENAPI